LSRKSIFSVRNERASVMPKMCVTERGKDSTRGQNAQGAKSWPRQSKSFASAQAEGTAAALVMAQCPSGASGPTGLFHIALAHRAVEISHHLASRRCASVLPSSPNPSPGSCWTEDTSLPLRCGWSSKHLVLPSPPWPKSYRSRLSLAAGLLS